MQQGTTGLLRPWVVSDFERHSLTATVGIVSGLMSGLFKLPLAKIIDIWGRPQGFAAMVFLMTIGLVMMAACKNVETYAAAQCFYWVGYTGTVYVNGIFVADTSALRNRGLMFAFTGCPYIFTVWITGPLSQAFLDGPGWRWCFGVFAIITPIICAPLFFIFKHNENKAKKAGLIKPREASGRTVIESIKYYLIEFDIVGLLLICTGLALFLLSFSLYSYQENTWKSPLIICFLIFGGLLIIAFALYEKFLAPVTFIPYALLLDRSVFGACILAGVLFIVFYIWNSYFYSMLFVVYDLNATHAGYIGNIYSIGSCLWAIVVGFWIRYDGRVKPVALYFGIPMTILGVALMIEFRQPGVNIGYIVMCQIFYAFAGGTLVICEQVIAIAVTSHQYVAVVLAIEGMFASVGGGIGGAIATAIWTGTFPKKLREFLPEDSKANWMTIYGSLGEQLAFPMGSPERDAINRAYGDSQKLMLIASTCLLAIAIGAVAIWRNVNVKNFKQVKGMVA